MPTSGKPYYAQYLSWECMLPSTPFKTVNQYCTIKMVTQVWASTRTHSHTSGKGRAAYFACICSWSLVLSRAWLTLLCWTFHSSCVLCCQLSNLSIWLMVTQTSFWVMASFTQSQYWYLLSMGSQWVSCSRLRATSFQIVRRRKTRDFISPCFGLSTWDLRSSEIWSQLMFLEIYLRRPT